MIFTMGVSSKAAEAVTLGIPHQDKTHLKILADKLNLRLSGSKSGSEVKINLNAAADGLYTVNIQGTEILIVPKPEAILPISGEANIDIQASSLTANVKIKSGSVQVQSWPKDLFVNLFSGSVLSREGAGELTIMSQKASITVQDHKGKVVLDSYSGDIQAKSIEGDMLLESFSGDVTVDSAKGHFKLVSGQASVRVLNGEGQLNLDLSRGSLNTNNFKGRVAGEARESQVFVRMHQESDVNIRTQSGKLTVQSAPGVGPYVYLFASEGDIYTPGYIKVERDTSGRYARGKIRGSGGGSIVLRAVDGSLVVR